MTTHAQRRLHIEAVRLMLKLCDIAQRLCSLAAVHVSETREYQHEKNTAVIRDKSKQGDRVFFHKETHNARETKAIRAAPRAKVDETALLVRSRWVCRKHVVALARMHNVAMKGACAHSQ